MAAPALMPPAVRQPASSSWQRKATAMHTVARKLSDEGMYIVGIIDMEPAGVLVQAYNEETCVQYTLSPSETELATAGLSRSREDLAKLALSVDIFRIGQQTFIHSDLPGIEKPKIVPAGDDAREFIKSTPVGGQMLPELLTTALSELCKVKPQGLEAVRWLGEWLIANNPNKPSIGEPEDEEA